MRILAPLLPLFALLLIAVAPALAEPSRPNIVIILTDDTYDGQGSYGALR